MRINVINHFHLAVIFFYISDNGILALFTNMQITVKQRIQFPKGSKMG